MENEKVLIAGGIVLGAYLLFGGGKKKSSLSSGGDDLNNIVDDFEEGLDEEAQELADLYDTEGEGIDFDSPGELEDYYEEEINERAKALADQLTSISASGGGGGGNGKDEKNGKEGEKGPKGKREEEVDWCGTMITQAEADAAMAEMTASQAADTTGGSYQQDPWGSNCWQWVEPPPTIKNTFGPIAPSPGGVQTGASVAAGGWSSGAAPVQMPYTGGPATSYQGMVDPYSFVSTQH